MLTDRALRFVVKPLVFLAALGPAGYLLWAAVTGHLGANPLSDVTNETGVWTLRFLCLTIFITPLRRLTGWSGLARFRRNVGVATFCYATLHWVAYAWFDMEWSWPTLLADLPKRPFILVGTVAWLAMLPLAATSFNAAVRALGGRAWRDLHKVTYVLGPLAILHFWWMRAGKHDLLEPALYGLLIAGLLLARRWQRA